MMDVGGCHFPFGKPESYQGNSVLTELDNNNMATVDIRAA